MVPSFVWNFFCLYLYDGCICSNGDVRINWIPVTTKGTTLKSGDIVSVSGKGRLKVTCQSLKEGQDHLNEFNYQSINYFNYYQFYIRKVGTGLRHVSCPRVRLGHESLPNFFFISWQNYYFCSSFFFSLCMSLSASWI